MDDQRCGAFHPLTGELCARQSHADTVDHQAADGCHWPANAGFWPLFPASPPAAGMTTDTKTVTAVFTREAWEAGYAKAEQLGLSTDTLVSSGRRVTRRDVDEIVSAVAQHGSEELYVESALPNGSPGDEEEVRAAIRKHLTRTLAVEAIQAGCVMITLPREVIYQRQPYLTMMRLIVPVRRLREEQ